MTASEFGSFVLAFLVALILFFGGQRALIELTDNEDFALPVQVTVDEPDTADLPSAPVLPPESVPGPPDQAVPPDAALPPEEEVTPDGNSEAPAP